MSWNRSGDEGRQEEWKARAGPGLRIRGRRDQLESSRDGGNMIENCE